MASKPESYERPNRAETEPVTLRLPRGMVEYLRSRADANARTVGKEVMVILERALARERKDRDSYLREEAANGAEAYVGYLQNREEIDAFTERAAEHVFRDGTLKKRGRPKKAKIAEKTKKPGR